MKEIAREKISKMIVTDFHSLGFDSVVVVVSNWFKIFSHYKEAVSG
jgi:hypothetical protein